ncbi:MAG: tetratricopeptide repeat protein [Acidobacteria bacterium]|nr:tetratricopeptide repeat protein [Acidobacteriota bacterium]
MPTILDFQIQPLSAESYSLAVCERSSSQPLASATFSHRVDFLTDFSVDRLNASTKDAAERFDELQKLGRELYQKLFLPAVEQVWHEYKQRSEFLILCLRFAKDAAKLEVLPWETLHDGAEFIAAGTKTTLTRLPLDVAPPSELPPIPRQLKLFGFFASPLDLQDHERLNAEREQEILLEAINDPAAQGRISADFEDEAKLEILARSLKDGYHILHFTGHGISPRDGGGLLLEDAHGKKLPASIAEVMQAVESGVDRLRLAVISGCQTARTLHTGAFNDLARELLRQRVPAVIAMQFSITDEGGLKFAEVLYREIAKGVELERAVHAARRVLLADERFFINNDALAIVLLAADGACLQTTEAQSSAPQTEPGATYLGDRLDPLAHGFYGRRREYRKLRDALLHQDQRAVIIHGIGGIGKTALLTHAINRLRPRFKDVMSFDCRRAALGPETILLELHRYFAAQGKPQLQSLIGQNLPPETLANEIEKLLTEWPLLIVFDNFESQLDERREFINEDLRVFLTTLVRATATGSRFLFTTRYLFDLDGERLGNLQELPLGDLSRPEALMLMQKLPNLAQAAYRDKPAVLEKFGGHPYALVTLDRHCSHQPLDQALQDASLLKSELREFLAIELNYRRLSDRARELLTQLAAFQQTVPTDAAEWMMGEKVSQADEVDRILASLDRNKLPVEWNQCDDAALRAQIEKELPEQRSTLELANEIRELIEWGLVTPVSEDGQMRALSVHSLVRDFCCGQHLRETWRERLRDAAKFFTNHTLLTRKEDKTPADVWSEMEAFKLLMEAEEFEDATWLLANAHSLLENWGFNRFVGEQFRRLSSKLDSDSDVLATFLHHQARTMLDQNEYDAALEQFQRSVKIAEKQGNQAGVASSLLHIGNIHHDRCEYKAALEHYHRSLAISEGLGHQAGVASSLQQIGIIHQECGEYGMALEQYRCSHAIREELGDRAGMASTLHQIGTIHFYRRDYGLALEHYQRSLAISEELGHRIGLAGTLYHIGIIHHDRGEYDAALEHYRRSLAITEELGNRPGLARLLHEIGMIHQECGDYGLALEQYQHSLAINKELGRREGVAISLCQLGQLFTEIGRYTEAFLMLLNAQTIRLELQSPKSPHARIVVNNLIMLRVMWGVRNFDAAWREVTGGEVSDDIKKGTDDIKKGVGIRGILKLLWKSVKQAISQFRSAFKGKMS